MAYHHVRRFALLLQASPGVVFAVARDHGDALVRVLMWLKQFARAVMWSAAPTATVSHGEEIQAFLASGGGAEVSGLFSPFALAKDVVPPKPDALVAPRPLGKQPFREYSSSHT